MSSPVIGASAVTTIRDAAEQMRAHGVGSLPIMQDHKVIGIVTDRDIVTRALAAQGIALGPDAKVASIMSHGVITCRADQDATEAAVLMGERQVRRLVVIERADAPVGILSLGDIAEHASEELAGQALGEISEARARDDGRAGYR